MKYTFIAIILLFMSCGGSNTQLDYRTRDLIDSLTKQQNEIIAKEMEQYCRDSFNILVQKAVDSLIIVRQREIEQTIGREIYRDTVGQL
jgi:hypothetical protein